MNIPVLLICVFVISYGFCSGKRKKPQGSFDGTFKKSHSAPSPGYNAVENLRNGENSENVLVLLWDPPNTDDTVVKYTIAVNFLSNNSKEAVETTNTYYRFHNVEPCSDYLFVVNVVMKKRKRKSKEYKPQELQVYTPVLEPYPPNNFTVDFKSKVVKWVPNANRSYCLRGWNLKFYHSNLCIKDIVLSKEATQYALSDVTSCTRYILTMQALGVDPVLNSKIIKIESNTDLTDLQMISFVENLSYVIENHDKIFLTWTASAVRPECIYDYVVSIPNYVSLPLMTTRETHMTLSNLNACAKYRVTVMARTLYREFIGKSADVLVETSALVPGPVRDVHVISIDGIEAYLYWLPPNYNVGCVHKYEVRQEHTYGWNKESLVMYTEKPNMKLNIVPCMSYTFGISALNSERGGGEVVEITYMFLQQEHHIQNLSFSEANGNLIVKWKLADVEVHCLDYYTLDICAIDAMTPCRSYKPSTEIQDGEVMVTVPDVLPCATYKVTISIVGTDKQYVFFSEIHKTKERVFAPPVFKKTEQVTSRSAKLKWSMRYPNASRCSLLSSILECTVDGNAFMSYEYSAQPGPDIITEVTKLSPFTSYSCYLSLNQPIGRSEKSAVVEFTTLEDVPSAVHSLTLLRASSNSISVAWKPPAFTNGVLKKYSLQVKRNRALYDVPSWCNDARRTSMKASATLTTTDLSHEFKNLNPFEEYSVSITAASGVGFGEVAELTAATAPAAPDVVYQPQCLSTSPFTYTLTWKQPCRPNGILKKFKVLVIGTRDQHSDDRFSYSIMANLSFPDTLYSVKLPKLRPVFKYQLQISAAVDKVDEYGLVSILELSTPASLPPKPAAEHLVKKVNPRPVDGQNGTRVEVTLTRDMFDDYGGDVLYYALLIGRDISPNHNVESETFNVDQGWPEMGKWSESSTYDFVFQYQATPPYWNPFGGKDPNGSVTYVIGQDTFCESAVDGYCNGALKSETKYSMKVRAFTSAGYQDSPPLKFSTGSEIETSKSNYLLAFCVVLFLGFVICGLFYVKTRHIPVFVEVTQRMNGRRKLNVVATKTIPIKTFPEYYAKLQDTPHILKIEFNELNEVSAKYNLSDNIAKRYDNYRKNRYVNIVPYDETRVKINTEKGDYINASFIEGYKSVKNRYIACQGPLASTFADFWTMILQYDISVIVMLCQIIENKKTVCEKYFPDVNQTLNFDSIRVECTIMTSNSLFEERRIKVTQGVKELVVSHIKFLEWPDFGIPSNPDILVDFCNAVRKRWTDKPTVVHCSAGVGRTGTFIACDILLQQLPNSKTVNIFNTVLQLRKQRPGMVQSVTQYTYLYECVYNGIKKLQACPTK